MKPPRLIPGQRLGPYEVLEHPEGIDIPRMFVDEGVLARHTILGREAVLYVTCEPTPEKRARFEQAARQCASLNHPHINAIYDAGELPSGWLYMATGHWPGSRSLDHLINQGRRPALTPALRLVWTLCGALHHLHARGLVHKCITPDTILLDGEGVARLDNVVFAAPLEGDPLVKPGMAVGNPWYMAPEQVRANAVGPQADLWAMGATLYELLLGEKLNPRQEPLEAMRWSVEEGPVDLSALFERVPDFVLQIVARCMERDPAARYGSALELAGALEQAMTIIEQRDTLVEVTERLQTGEVVFVHGEHRELERQGQVREFEVLGLLGTGAYGEVFRARDIHSGRSMALKLLRQEWLREATTIERFRREAELLARIQHRNVVRVYNFGQFAGTFFMALELIEGGSLDGVLKARAPLATPEAVRLAGEVLDGLEAVHRMGIIHRDLKPENIGLVDGRVVLMDFGVAASGDAEKLTNTGAMIGTPAYMAPEQARGQEYDHRADLYSLGVVLYELLTGRLPYEEQSLFTLLYKLVAGTPTPITDHRADLPEGLVALVGRLIARDPDERPLHDEIRARLVPFT